MIIDQLVKLVDFVTLSEVEAEIDQRGELNRYAGEKI